MPLLHKPTTERFAIPLVADLQVVSVLDHTTGIALTFTACWDRKINYRRTLWLARDTKTRDKSPFSGGTDKNRASFASRNASNCPLSCLH